MMDVSAIEKAIAARLTPLRLALEDNGVLVAALPKEVGAYSEETKEGIDIIVSRATGTGSISFMGNQDIQYTITINVSLGLRYQDLPSEKNVLDWVCTQIFNLLYNYALPDAKTGLFFVEYLPLKPENGQWLTQMQFSFFQQAVAGAFVVDDGSLGVQFVQLFAEGSQPTDNTLIDTIPHG